MKIFNLLLTFYFFIINVIISDCIGASKNSLDPQEVAEFNIYLKELTNITELTPHAEAHFFDSGKKQPLSPPSKKQGEHYVIHFTKAQAVSPMTRCPIPYTVFKNSWKELKDYVKNHAQEITEKKSKNGVRAFTVIFDTPLQISHIKKICFRRKGCQQRLEKISKLNPFFLNERNHLTTEELNKWCIFSKILEKCVIYKTTDICSSQAKFIIQGGKIKTAYPVLLNQNNAKNMQP
ncbi:MAG: hypothetical protein BGO07_02345 [Alphaproteobacteria bacterium 40-19]|nr:MAG: hypothetical protein BGO07_02345 [Alphaproteobacteria bacterium 40-19]